MDTPILPRVADVLCPIHGRKGLNEYQYHEQIASTDQTFTCPACQSPADVARTMEKEVK